MDAFEKVIVIGAGIVGVSTAIWLQRSGCKVTLIDREGPAAGASFGNAGIIASAAIAPISTPGITRSAPGMFLSKNQPLFMRLSYLPQLWPFLRGIARRANMADACAATAAMSQLISDAYLQHRALAEGTDAESYIRDGDYVYAYKDKESFKKDHVIWDLRKKFGVRYHELDAAGLGEYDHALAGRFGYGAVCGNNGHITDPGAYIRALADHFVAKGGELVQATVHGFDAARGEAVSVKTDQGNIAGDAFVLAAGAYSAKMAAELGMKIPLVSERGYHVEFHNPSLTFKCPILVSSGKFAVSSMNGRLRCAGFVEFAPCDAPPGKAPTALLKRKVAEIFPDLSYDHTTEWVGSRPSTPDSLPVIGPSPTLPNVFFGFGHQHVGLTGGPKTGRLLAQMITGSTPNEDVSAFSPQRM